MKRQAHALAHLRIEEFPSFDLSDFKFEMIRPGDIITLSRGRHILRAETLLLAHASSRRSEGEAEHQLDNEFGLRDVLGEAWALKPTARIRRGAGIALVYPDIAAAALSLQPSKPLPVRRFLSTAIGIVDAVRQMHESGLIHNAITPANILVDEAGRYRLTGFGAAVRSRRELCDELRNVAIEALPYLSPEHTGRTRHPIDSRSDLYSLGLILYRLLTGRLPYEASRSANVDEWIHLHIASAPIAPHLVVASIPEGLSLLVLKLLAKSPERRYQTAAGLAVDLERCGVAWNTLGRVAPFDLGTGDRPLEVVMPERVYGREKHLDMLFEAFETTRRTAGPSLVLVKGPSGIGKSALLDAFLSQLEPCQAWRGAGKADQYRRELPYSVLADALRPIVLEILGQPDDSILYWRQRLRQALGPYGKVVTEVIPALELLTGSLAPAPAAEGSEAENRFHRTIHQLVSAFATRERPLVLLIDDLQWLDTASVNLLSYLVSSSEQLPLMLLISSRDGAANSEVAIEELLAKLGSNATQVVEATLDALDVGTVEHLIGDALGVGQHGLHDIASLVHDKTHGNPLFVGQFLRTLVEDRLIVYDAKGGMWRFDYRRIRQRDYTDNVADLVLQRLERLPPRTRTTLGGVACLGGHADIKTLCALYSLDPNNLHALLAPALEAECLRLDDERYAFSHDRVQEAAHRLLNAGQQKRLHLEAGRLLAEAAMSGDMDKHLFQALDHYSQAIDIVADPDERLRLVEMGLLAAQHAKRAIAYRSAMRYLDTALAVADAATPERLYSLKYEQAECEFLAGDISSALDRINLLLAISTSRIVAAQTWRLKIEVHLRLSEIALAVDSALAALQGFGIQLAPHPTSSDCDAAYVRIRDRLDNQPLETLLQLPEMSDPETKAAMALLGALVVPARFTDGNLHFFQLCHMLQLTLDHGMSGPSAVALSRFALLICDRYEQYADGFRYGQIARELVSRHQYLAYEARTLLPLSQLSVWTQPLSYSIDCVNAVFSAAIANGDITTACYECLHQVWNLHAKGENLNAVASDIERGLAFVSKAGYKVMEETLLMQLRFVNLLRCQPMPSQLQDQHAEAGLNSEHGPAYKRTPTFAFWHWVYEAMANYVERDFTAALACLARASTLTWTAPGHISLLHYHLVSALALAAIEMPVEKLEARRQQLLEHGRKLNGWAAANPSTFSDKALLVQGEIARIDGNALAAMALYDEAARRAAEHGFVQYEALAHELAASLGGDLGMLTAKTAHLNAAHDAYGRWGARIKLVQLETLYPELLERERQITYAFAVSEQLRDVESVVRFSRALSEEIELDRLIETLMVIALEHAGAQRGLLILLHGGSPIIAAHASTTPSGIQIDHGRRAPTAEDLPGSMLQTAIHTGKRVVIGKAQGLNPFATDEYFHHQEQCAAICVPMLKQTELVGVLYLENRQMSEGFTVEHFRVLELLAAQAAISLENARLYTDLVNENRQRQQLEKSLRDSEAFLAMGERVSQTGSWRWDLQRDELICSEEFCRIFEIDTAIRSFPCSDFLARIHPDDRDMVTNHVRTRQRHEQPIQVEYRFVRSDNTIRYLAVIGTPLFSEGNVMEYVGTTTDTTARREAEDALRSAQADLSRAARVSTVGQLTASIAHEINQPLMSIVTNAGASLRWLNRQTPDLEFVRDGLMEIEAEGRRAGDIIHGLQTLTRKSAPVFTEVDMHELIRHIHSIARSHMERRQISAQLALNAMRSVVLGDGVQIQQVFLNLIMNAVEAMSEVTDRTRTLSISSTVTESDYLQVKVEDTGTGMSEDTVRHVFEPFYTTKKNGMGMGLAICQSIVTAHKGRLSAGRRYPHGSVFTFVIPLARTGEG